MSVEKASQDLIALLGLRQPRGVLRDRSWWVVLASGTLAAVAVFPVSGLDPWPSVPAGLLRWVGVLAWQPLFEELLFRGLLQGLILEQSWGRETWMGLSIANLGATLAFAAVHLAYHTPLWAAAVVPPSLAFGWLRERHRSVWTAVVAHTVFNGGFFLGAAWLAA